MKRYLPHLLILLIFISIIFLISKFRLPANPPSSEPVASSTIPSEVVNRESPKRIVEDFYTWYKNYQGNPVADKSYQRKNELSQEFVNKTDRLILTFTGGGYDPFICAQDKPLSNAFGNERITEEKAYVDVEQTFDTGKRLLPVELTLVGDQWKISGILCSEVKPQQGLGMN